VATISAIATATSDCQCEVLGIPIELDFIGVATVGARLTATTRRFAVATADPRLTYVGSRHVAGNCRQHHAKKRNQHERTSSIHESLPGSATIQESRM
jgi:hypothetical protein